ncbi:hypothetical protein BBJ28_00004600 [Nothophytophthora sp. Chile5]|nr:hypothetical protein BBJ28_00004600 [Nothophytophthora sp. Chile5]
MPAALLAMEEHNYLVSDLSAMRDSFGSDSLSGLHPSWLDDEQLNNCLPMIDDAFADVSTPTTRDSDAGAKAIAAMDNDHTERSVAVLIDAAGEHDQHFLDGALEFSFDQELSPILEPFAAVASSFDAEKDDEVVAKAPFAADTPRRKRRQAKSPLTRQTAASPVRHVPHLATPMPSNDVFTNLKDVPAFPSPLVVSKRPRTRSSSLPWTKQEQNSFFSIFKAKWPRAADGESEQPFSSLLLHRFDVISTKVKTKSVMEVRLFYTTVMRHITELLQDVAHDIDLTNPDQVRIAVWCWSKLMADETHSEE